MWIFILLSVHLAHAASVLEGDWVRVVDGCEDLPLDQILKLPESGGGNLISHGENLSFRGANYRAQLFPPPRCAVGFVPSGPDIQAGTEACDGGFSAGTMSIQYQNVLFLNATERDGRNFWGTSFRTFEFELFREQVLLLQKGNADYTCPDQNRRIYFIRAPNS